MARLVIPIRLDVLLTREGRSVCGQDVHFDWTPYVGDRDDRHLDMNSDRPYLAEAIETEPFQSDTLYLTPGHHLHWALPAFLCSTKCGAKSATDFPTVPNRWYVRRELAVRQVDGIGGAPLPQSEASEWIVESDFLWSAEQPGNYTVLPVDLKGEKTGRPFGWMGKCLPLSAWTGEENANCFDNLTALGWGSPAFDTFYPNCQSVFGMCDPETAARPYTYTVVGWYSNPRNDYLRDLLDELRKEAAELEARQKKALEQEQRTELFARFKKDHRLEFGDCDWETALGLEGMILWGQASLSSRAEAPSSASLETALAPTPEEALSALLSRVVTEPRLDSEAQRDLFEDQLEAIMLGDQLKSLNVDIGLSLRELRHQRSFSPVDSGWSWAIRFEPPESVQTPGAGTESAESKSPSMPEDWNVLLRSLNAAQTRFDSKRLELESLQDRLYADWYRYMICCYPPAGELDVYPGPDEVMSFIRGGSLRKCAQLKNSLGELPDLPKPPEGTRGSVNTLAPWTRPQSGVRTGTPTNADTIMAGYNVLIEVINAENQRRVGSGPADAPPAPGGQWKLERVAAPRFWQPTPPAVILAAQKGGVLDRSERLGPGAPDPDSDMAGDGRPDPEATASRTLGTQHDPRKPSDTAKSIARMSRTWPRGSVGINRDGADCWHPFRAEWEAEYFPLATMSHHTRRSGDYDPDFIVGNVLLGENEAEFQRAPDLRGLDGITKGGSVYVGKAFISHEIAGVYRKRLSDACQELAKGTASESTSPGNEPTDKQLSETRILQSRLDEAVKWLDQHDVVALTLGGFNDALLQQHAELRMKPNDPLGFKEYQLFTEEVSRALGDEAGKGPDPQVDFNPVRGGALKLNAIRLIDTFGRAHPLEPTDVHVPVKLRTPGEPDYVWLMPRFAQPMQATFRFDPAVDTSQVATAARAANPVVAWVIPNFLDSSLMFFDPDGNTLGSINHDGGWLRGRASLEEIQGGDATYLAKVTKWLMRDSTGPAAFLQGWVRNLTEAVEHIHPEDRAGSNALAVMVGRPLAIVKASLWFRLLGRPAMDHSWSALRQVMVSPERETRGFTRVKIPYRLGEYGQINDGLVGFWPLEGDGSITRFLINDSLSGTLTVDPGVLERDHLLEPLIPWLKDLTDNTVRKQDVLAKFPGEGARMWQALVNGEQPYLSLEKAVDGVTHYADASEAGLAVDDKPATFLLLLDPHGEVNLHCGVQPAKAITLPEAYYKEALQRIELKFLVSPLITPRAATQISPPREQGYHWSWIQYSKGPWIPRDALEKLASGLYDRMLEAGWLIPLEFEGESALHENGRVAIPDYERIRNRFDSTVLGADYEDLSYQDFLMLIGKALEKQIGARASSRLWQSPWISRDRCETEQPGWYDQMLEAGCLIPLAFDHRDIAVPDYGRIKLKYGPKNGVDPNYNELLARIAKVLENDAILHPFQLRAGFDSRLEIREGWLSLLHDLND